jgi:hypothetical protein
MAKSSKIIKSLKDLDGPIPTDEAPEIKNIITSAGIAVFPHLNSPSMPNIEGYDKGPRYSTLLRLKTDDQATQDLIELIDAVQKANIANSIKENGKSKSKDSGHVGYTEEYERDEDNKETEDLTGYTLFNFRLDAEVFSKRKNKTYKFSPALFDSNLQPTTVEIGGGSEIRIIFDARGWWNTSLGCGVKLTLRKVQVIQARQGGGRDETAEGFDVVEDGFVEQGSGFEDGTESGSGSDGASDY